MLAACAGFLWFNAAPAEIFMGDTGSLAIGTALAICPPLVISDEEVGTIIDAMAEGLRAAAS